MSALAVRTKLDAAAARDAAQKVVQTHQRLADFLRPGQTLAQIDRFVAATLDELGCTSCFLKYRQGRLPAFPSHACLSVNDCIVHGTAAGYVEPMKAGDVLKIDIGVFFRGWVGDAAWTYSFGEPSPVVARLMTCGKESLRRGIAALKPGEPWIAWARAVQDYVESPPPRGCGFHLVRGLGGHGYGHKKLHGPPFVANSVPRGDLRYEWPDGLRPVEPGSLVALEPMIAQGTGETDDTGRTKRWPVHTQDGSIAVHYEHDVLITEDGVEVLTEGMDGLRDVIA
ncbi:MAG: M24 family metallopeptidase [Phycisphaerales bacterium]